MLLPYLRSLTASQIERGLITYVAPASLQLRIIDPSLSLTWAWICRHEDDVRQFRELLQEKGMPVPVKQTTLAIPTESEDRIATAGEK